MRLFALATVVGVGVANALCTRDDQCLFGATCNLATGSCSCSFDCHDQTQVCSWSGETFDSRCHLLASACEHQRNIVERCTGPCGECDRLNVSTEQVSGEVGGTIQLRCDYNHPETPLTMISPQNRPKVLWHKNDNGNKIRVAKTYNYQVRRVDLSPYFILDQIWRWLS